MMKKKVTGLTRRKPETEIELSRTVRPLLFRNYLVSAIAEKVKDETRRIVLPNNSRVIGVPASARLDGVDLSTGRGTPDGDIRARRTFDNGQVRVVPVTSVVRPKDLFWIKTSMVGARRDSQWTLEVISVRGVRLQDMTNADALREGVSYLPEKLLRRTAADLQGRNAFAVLWDDIVAKDEHKWRKNPWVWVYRFKAYRHNVDSSALAKILQAA